MTEVVEVLGSSSPKSEDTQPGSAKTVAHILTAAAALIEKPGAWSQGGTKDRHGRETDTQGRQAAAWGLIEAIYRVEPRNDPLREAAINYVCRLPGIGRGLAAWNDVPGRTQAHVVSVLRQAAALAREQGR